MNEPDLTGVANQRRPSLQKEHKTAFHGPRVNSIRFSASDETWLQERAAITLSSPPVQERRRHSRFLLRSPTTLVVKQGRYVQPVEAITENISLGGMSITTLSPLPEHATVGFVIDVLKDVQHKPIRVKGTGRITRVEACPLSGLFTVGIKCSRPMYRAR